MSQKPNDNNVSDKGDRQSGKFILFVTAGIATVAIIFIALGVLNRNGDGSSLISTEMRSNGDQSSSATSNPNLAAGTLITAGDSEFGTMLFDEKKQAIYIWELEESIKAECYGDCSKLWPPVLTDGEPQAGDGVNGDLLGITKRTDGGTQVTYNGHPLYYYAHEGVGEVKCHNVSTHGGLWWVIHPSGDRAL